MTEPWLERWVEGRIGWHEAGGNASLHKHWSATGKRVLVPLCGKTPDLLWLEEQGNDVVGVELSDLAVKAFFDENRIAYTTRDAGMTVYAGTDRRVTIYCGDFFEFDVAGFDACYDRGSLITMPPDIRPAYVKHLDLLLTSDVSRLLITIDYDDSIATGPPYSVPGDEVLSYWPSLDLIDRYDDIDNGPPKFHDAGLTEMFENVWR
ncbi:MAG: thiopurine S-methyltransferase [Woeseiaceae bacterium]